MTKVIHFLCKITTCFIFPLIFPNFTESSKVQVVTKTRKTDKNIEGKPGSGVLQDGSIIVDLYFVTHSLNFI